MVRNGETLFRMGEITKILGVTRKALLVYENMGLLTPAYKNEASGYRYYTADNMTQIRAIRSLQAVGLSLLEIEDYYYNTENVDQQLAHLLEVRAALDRNIQMLQVRSVKGGDLSVHVTNLPKQTCFCRQYQCKDTSEAAANLRETYIAAAQTGSMSLVDRMFTIRMGSDPSALDLLCCIPLKDDFQGEERMEFAATPALCIYYRGPYEGTNTAVRALTEYVEKNHIETTAPIRSIYLEGPPNRGTHSEDYITQIAVPIKRNSPILHDMEE